MKRLGKWTLPVLVGGFIVAFAAFPWGVGLSYSKGNDFFYWLHFAWWLEPYLLRGGLPDWTMLSGCGQPTFNLDQIPDAVGLALLTGFFGLEGGIRAFVIIGYVVGGAGMFRLAHGLTCSRQGALVATAAYLLSWYLIRTVDFYVYTSNFLQLFLLPWILLFFRQAVQKKNLAFHLGAGVLISLCILANPQMAIKVVGFSCLWLLFEQQLLQRQGYSWGAVLKTLGLIGIFAAWLSAFHIATALIHRHEVHTFGERVGLPKDWRVFVDLPFFVLVQLGHKLGVDLGPGPSLHQVIDAHYWGFSVFFLGLFPLFRKRGRPKVVLLWLLTGIALLIYWGSSWLPASEWIGTPRQMLFITTFCAALLSGYGAVRALAWLRLRKVRGGRWLPLGVVLAELVTLKGVFFIYGPHHLPLEEIPQLKFLREVSAEHEWALGDRFYTFQPDLAYMLYPAFTGRPMANRIHQRDYLRAFFSYQDTLEKVLCAPPPFRPQISEYLGLLNVRYLEVPLNGISGRFKPYYAQILEHLGRDPGLVEIARRYPGPTDQEWNRFTNLTKGAMVADPELPAQVVFENHRAQLALFPAKTIAVLGEPKASQQAFAKISLSLDFRYDFTLYLLCENPEELRGVEAGLSGALGLTPGLAIPEGIDRLDLEQLDVYRAPDQLHASLGEIPRVEKWEDYEVQLEVASSSQSRFVGISLERFVDWHAYDGQGKQLRAFRAGAGLTAVYLPAGVERVVLRYERPAYKTGWRLFSLAGLLTGLAGLIWRWRRRPWKKKMDAIA